MKDDPAVPGSPLDEYADVVEYPWVFDHVGFFFACPSLLKERRPLLGSAAGRCNHQGGS
jgi:hypothetical protein